MTNSQQNNNIKMLENMNKNIFELVKLISNSNIIRSEKSVPYNSVVTIETITKTKPSNPDEYLNKEDVYANNNSRPIKFMNIINDGPGNIYFIQSLPGKQGFSSQEEVLNVGDMRALHNVYEIRLRTNMPFTSYRLVEGEIQSGSFARSYKANTEIRPTLQANEKIKAFSITIDNDPALIPIMPPIPAVYFGPSFHTPLIAGATEQLVDIETGLDMPFIVPQGHIVEAFSFLTNFNRDWSLRAYFELIPGTGIYNHAFTLPSSARGELQWLLNINPVSTEVIDPYGAPAGGRGILFTVTNDDATNTMIGELDIIMILKKVI